MMQALSLVAVAILTCMVCAQAASGESWTACPTISDWGVNHWS